MSEYLSGVNSGFFYLLTSCVLGFITIMSFVFLVKSYRAGIQIGMDKNDFNRICIDPTFVPSRENLEAVCRRMKLTEEETQRLLAYAKPAAE